MSRVPAQAAPIAPPQLLRRSNKRTDAHEAGNTRPPPVIFT